MKNLLLFLLLLTGINAPAQFSAYDPFDDNANEWITRDNDSAVFAVQNGKLDMNISKDGDYINAKGAPVNQEKLFRVELRTEYVAGADTVPYGICWGAADLSNYYSFYITPQGKFGFRHMEKNVPFDYIVPTTSRAIKPKGNNWLRINMFSDSAGKKKMNLVINEEIVATMGFVFPFGNFFGAYVGGKNHILFDDFIVYQRGEIQDIFEPCDLSLSLACTASHLRYNNALYSWSACIDKGCRVDVDSAVTRFWYFDNRCGDYSVLAVSFPSTGNVSFARAVEQDFGDYMAEGDSITHVRRDPAQLKSMGNEAKVYVISEVYTSYDLEGNLFIRRYYVDHPFGKEKGMVFQFICPENSPYIPVLDQLVQGIIGTIEITK
ncbi:MAG: hypothetical protein M3R17_18475 [Bacteroidota bacterium]|nr:hypothetical protein [Bacteroidota bacterium]